jgi:hypothetical protein
VLDGVRRVDPVPTHEDGFGVSPSAARALPCRAVRAGASAPFLDGRRLRALVALAAVRAVWQPSGASSWVRPRLDHRPHVRELVACMGSPDVGARVQGGAPGRRRPYASRPVVLVDVVAAAAVLPGPPGRVRAPGRRQEGKRARPEGAGYGPARSTSPAPSSGSPASGASGSRPRPRPASAS